MTDKAKPKPFAFGCSVEVFPPEELAALSAHGNRLEGLAEGTVRAASPEDEHFLRVDRDEVEPETVMERAWVRMKARREIERADRQKTPPPPPPSYGMIEFDADRCWW
jgi:uncharacterized protein YifE (UPF0438 family)